MLSCRFSNPDSVHCVLGFKSCSVGFQLQIRSELQILFSKFSTPDSVQYVLSFRSCSVFSPLSTLFSVYFFTTAPYSRLNAFFHSNVDCFLPCGKKEKWLGICVHYITWSCDYSSCILCCWIWYLSYWRVASPGANWSIRFTCSQ
jgi:hypothetical protein